MRQIGQTRTITILVLPALLFLVIFFVMPIVFLLGSSFFGEEGGFTISGYTEFFSTKNSLLIYWRTLRIGIIVTVLATLFAYPGSYLLARMPAVRRSLLISLMILPLMTNPVARTYAWLIILGRFGIVNKTLMGLGLTEEPIRLLFTEGAIIIGLLQLFLPLMVLSLVGALENISDEVIEAARSLGANGFTAFFRVVVPLSSDGLVLGATLVFTGSITAYVTPAILGGSRVLMMSTLLRQRAMVALDWQGATVVAGIMLATALIINLLLRALRPKTI